MRKIINGICVVLGFIFLGLGAVGAILPILPTTPFLLLSAVLFAKGSKRFHNWFLHTKLYKKYLEDVVIGRQMTLKSKVKVLVIITLLLAVGFVLSPVWYAKVVIMAVLIGHYYYFIFQIKTTEKRIAVHE